MNINKLRVRKQSITITGLCEPDAYRIINSTRVRLMKWPFINSTLVRLIGLGFRKLFLRKDLHNLINSTLCQVDELVNPLRPITGGYIHTPLRGVYVPVDGWVDGKKKCAAQIDIEDIEKW